MYDKLIVCCSEPDLRDGLVMAAGAVRTALAPDVGTIVECYDVEDFFAEVVGTSLARYLIIVDTALAGRTQRSGSKPDSNGFVLVERLQKLSTRPACIVFTAVGDPDMVKAIEQLPLATPLIPNCQSDLAEDCRVIAKDLALRRAALSTSDRRSPPSAAKLNGYALLDISIFANKPDMTLKLAIKRPGRSEEPRGETTIRLKPGMLKAIVAESRRLGDLFLQPQDEDDEQLADWMNAYKLLGSQIYKLLNHNNVHFNEYWTRANERAPDATRVRFKLDHQLFDACWESMYNPANDRWYTLDSTITRRAMLKHSSYRGPIDGGDGIVNVLLIGSDVQRGTRLQPPSDLKARNYWNLLLSKMRASYVARHGVDSAALDLGDLFPPLPNLDGELNAIDLLGKAEQRLEVEILSSSGRAAGWSLFDAFKERLQGAAVGPAPRFDIVHFAGHAVFDSVDEDDGRGYLIFAGDKETRAVAISEFANLVTEAKVKMVYLSCCRSGVSRAAFELAKYGVPMAIGFQWNLRDDKAALFAKRFYRDLIHNDLKVCQAFHSARMSFLHANPEDPIWAAPVLVTQPDDWSHVEDSLGLRTSTAFI